MARPTVGHLDPQFLELMDDIGARLRTVFGTQNELTFPISGTGSAGMQAVMVNLLETGDTAIIGVNGVFGTRLAEMARRLGAIVVTVEAAWGRIIPQDELIAAHREHPDARMLAVVHAETSTGVQQPLAELGAHLRGSETLLVVDAVTSLGGIPVDVDEVGIDACYSGTQKCLGVPPGLSPVTFSPRAVERIKRRSSPCVSWYLDVMLIAGYLGSARRYHHTAPINALYGLHEGLLMLDDEGMEARYARHKSVGERLQRELLDRGFGLFAQEGHRLPQLTAAALPEGLDEGPLRAQLLTEHDVEVGGGLGPAQGKIWRIGLMGSGATDQSVDRLLAATDQLLGVSA